MPCLNPQKVTLSLRPASANRMIPQKNHVLHEESNISNHFWKPPPDAAQPSGMNGIIVMVIMNVTHERESLELLGGSSGNENDFVSIGVLHSR